MLPKGQPMVVYGIDEKPLGEVRAVRSCCFEVALPDGIASLRADAVYNVAGSRLTLVCMADGARSYSCLLHSSPSSRPATVNR